MDREWPRPLSTTEQRLSEAGAEQTDFFGDWAFAEGSVSEDFFSQWIFHLPKDWTLLPDGRVITGENVVWFPNGVAEEALILEQGTAFYQREVESFSKFLTQETGESYVAIPDDFILDYDQMSISSPSGWIYFYPNGLVVTPPGDLWFEPVSRNRFFSWFDKANYPTPGINEVQTLNNGGQVTYINMDSGFAWVQD